jgi:hypothetical protein
MVWMFNSLTVLAASKHVTGGWDYGVTAVSVLSH